LPLQSSRRLSPRVVAAISRQLSVSRIAFNIKKRQSGPAALTRAFAFAHLACGTALRSGVLGFRHLRLRDGICAAVLPGLEPA
jgi:hypothetical protein